MCLLVLSSFSTEICVLKDEKTRMHNVHPGPHLLSSSRLVGIASRLAGVSSWLARVCSWLAGASSWLAGTLPGWLESLLVGWSLFLAGWIFSWLAGVSSWLAGVVRC